MEKRARGGGGGELIERLPQSLLLEILARLDLESLCSAAPVCTAFRLSVSEALSSIATLDLSGFAPTIRILERVLDNNRVLQSLTLDCARLDDSSVEVFGKEQLQELVLLRCFKLSSYVFTAIGEKCPNLRLFALEMACFVELQSPDFCNRAIEQMLKGLPFLESLSIKFQPAIPGPRDRESIRLILPKTIKALLLQPISARQAVTFIQNMQDERDSNASVAGGNIFCLTPYSYRLQSLTLVLDRVTDELLFSVTNNLQHLVELCLEDKPLEEPSLPNDLTNSGLQSLGSCRNLTCLSLTRSKQNLPTTFRRVNDVGMFLLAEGCRKLESVRLGGFSKVTDAGYASILHSCKNLKRFEIVNAFFLSDLAFHNVADAPSSLVEVRLMSCNFLTCESAKSFSSCGNLEVLDLSGCKSIADQGLVSISEKLCKLTTLDLGGADITDVGLSALSGGSSPIRNLCLRGCKRITDRGITMLLHRDGIVCKTLLAFDLGYLPGISDRAITTIAESCCQISSLCIRHCFFVTDASISALASPGLGGRSLRKLDLYNCCGLSTKSYQLLACNFFRGLRWLGVGNTRFLARGKDRFAELSRERPGLSICVSGCEMDCKDGWQYHEPF